MRQRWRCSKWREKELANGRDGGTNEPSPKSSACHFSHGCKFQGRPEFNHQLVRYWVECVVKCREALVIVTLNSVHTRTAILKWIKYTLFNRWEIVFPSPVSIKIYLRHRFKAFYLSSKHQTVANNLKDKRVKLQSNNQTFFSIPIRVLWSWNNGRDKNPHFLGHHSATWNQNTRTPNLTSHTTTRVVLLKPVWHVAEFRVAEGMELLIAGSKIPFLVFFLCVSRFHSLCLFLWSRNTRESGI